MKNKSAITILILFSILINFISCSENPPTSPVKTLEEEIDNIAQKYLKVGMIIGVIDKNQDKLIFSYGSKTLSGNEKPDENTVFDIGSMTKTFTATLLTDLYLNNSFTDDTVDHYLPENVKLHTLNGSPIRIVHLATHSSCLPRSPHADGQVYRMPPGFDSQNPYLIYNEEHVYDYLTNYCELLFEPGTFWEYSYTGFGLLGHLVGLVSNSSYENVLQTKIFNVLDMNRSSLFLTDAQKSNYSLGYDPDLNNVPYFEANDIFQGAGFIKSTLNDLFKYLEANMGLTETPLKSAIDLAHQPQLHQGSMGEQALAWLILTLDDEQVIIYMGGDTLGHSTFVGFNKAASTGVIILSNYDMHGSQLTMGPKILEAILSF